MPNISFSKPMSIIGDIFRPLDKKSAQVETTPAPFTNRPRPDGLPVCHRSGAAISSKIRTQWHDQQLAGNQGGQAYEALQDNGDNKGQLERFGHRLMKQVANSSAHHQLSERMSATRGLEGSEKRKVYSDFSKNIVEPLAYDHYTRHGQSSSLACQTQDCRNTMTELKNLKKSGLKVQSQALDHTVFRKLPTLLPMELFNANSQTALLSNYRVFAPVAAGYPPSPSPMLTPRGMLESRYSVGIEAGMQGELVKLLPEIMRLYGGAINQVKVTAPQTQGVRPDGVIFYFARPDENRAISNDLARYLRSRLPNAKWRPPPDCMLEISNEGGTIGGYGETFTGNGVNHSFGSQRTELVANAIVNSLAQTGNDFHEAKTLFRAELKHELERAGYDPDCPALVSRKELLLLEQQ